MAVINIILDTVKHEQLKKLKGSLTWRQLLIFGAIKVQENKRESEERKENG